MDEVSIKLLSLADTDGLFQFELENRAYFERIGLPRGEAYYERASFEEILAGLIAEQEKGLHFMYLVRNAESEIVGRVNLTEVIGEPLRKAELGYRIGERHQGRGCATAAVRLVIGQAHLAHQLHRLEAGTAPDNIGSQLVLLKNGFEFAGRYTKHTLRDGAWIDSLLFEKALD